MNTDTRNIWIGAAVLIIIIGGIIFFARNKATAPDDTTTQVPKDWQTWESGSYDTVEDQSTLYTISYPKNFVVEKKGQAKGGFLHNPLVTLSFPEGSFDETKNNFKAGTAVISSSKVKNTEERCFTKPDGATGDYSDVDTTGKDYTMKRIDTEDARVYRTLYGGTCYEVALSVTTTPIDEADTTTISAFDKEEAYKVLEQIRSSLTLRKETGPLK